MGEVAALSTAAVWATASIMFARLGKSVSPLALNWLKCVIALALMVVFMWGLHGAVWPETLNLFETSALAVSGLVGLTLGDTLFFLALNRIGARRTLLLSALSPPTTAVLAVPVLGEPLTWPMAGGIGLTMAGVVWVIMERHPSDQPPDSDRKTDGTTDAGGSGKQGRSPVLQWGVVFGLGYALCQATGNVLTKLGGGEITALEISVVRLAFGIIGLTMVLGATRRLVETWRPMQETRTALLVVVATFFGTFLGIWFMNAGLRYTYTGIASTLMATSPIFVLPLAYVFQDEDLTLRSILGAIVAVIGVAILNLV